MASFGKMAVAPRTALAVAVGPLATRLDAMARQIAAADATRSANVRTISQAALAMTAGYVIWSLRGASLLASLLTSIPLWRSLDPLPILEDRADRAKRKAAKKARKAAKNQEKRGPNVGRDDDDKLGTLIN
jgi:hypothetical protein